MESNKKWCESDDVLLNVFLIYKRRHRVLLHYDTLIWEDENTESVKMTVPISDIIAIRFGKNSKLITEPYITNCCNQDPIEVITIKKIKKHFINIYYAKRLENKSNKTENNRWRKMVINLYNSDCNIMKLWYNRLNLLIQKQRRPKNILMFINPFGGRKNASKIYEKYCKPLMILAGIDVSCVLSQRANQIRDIIMTQSLDIYDGICCVGGDGTFSEIFNGLIQRTMKDMNLDPYRPKYIPKPKIPIGVIPGGSTDTVAYCIHGTTDVKTASIHIILGQTRGLDLSSVCTNNGIERFYASILSYGYLGDVAYESENFRWMGPKRYDYTGFKKLLLNRGYEGEIVLLKQNDCDSNFNDHNKCEFNCTKCLSEKNENNDLTNQQNNSKVLTNNIDYNILLLTSNYSNIQSKNNEWITVKGKFFMISGANISCSCAKCPNGFAPNCHLGDGNINLILVRHTTFLNNIRLLLTLMKSEGNICHLPFVEVHTTKKFIFRTTKQEGCSINGSCQPISISGDRVSQWNCDGEIIHNSEVLITSHQQIIDVFMRGPYPKPNHNNKNIFCC